MPGAKEIVNNIFNDDEKARFEEAVRVEAARQRAEAEQTEKEHAQAENFIRLKTFIDKTSAWQQLRDLGNIYLKEKGKVEFEERVLSCGRSEDDYWWGERVGSTYTLFHEHQAIAYTLIYENSRFLTEKAILPIFNTTRKIVDKHPVLFIGLITTTAGKMDLLVAPGELNWGDNSCLEDGHGKYKQQITRGLSYFENVNVKRPSEKRLVKAIAQAFYEGCNDVFKTDAPDIFRNGKNSSL